MRNRKLNCNGLSRAGFFVLFLTQALWEVKGHTQTDQFKLNWVCIKITASRVLWCVHMGSPHPRGRGWAVCVLTPHQGYKTHPDILTPWDLLDSQIT